MVSLCTVPGREGRSCEHFGGCKTINRVPLPLPLKFIIIDKTNQFHENKIQCQSRIIIFGVGYHKLSPNFNYPYRTFNIVIRLNSNYVVHGNLN